MNTTMKLGIAALAMNALLAGTAIVQGQIVSNLITIGTTPVPAGTITAGGTGIVIGSGGYGALSYIPPVPPPTNAVFHQVVDVFFDRDGNKLETRSATHDVNYDCHSGARNREDAIAAQDDGKGNVTFAQLRLPSEPSTGQKPITVADKVRVIMAAKPNTPVADEVPAASAKPLLADAR